MSKLLIEENPLILLPGLAKEIGLHEAIIIQQLHYWIDHKGPDGRRYGAVKDDKRWIRNTVSDWQKTNFCFLSDSQIYRAIQSLEEKELISSRKDLNKTGYDRTKWYTINYAILRQREMEITPARNPSDASEETIPETTTETNRELTGENTADLVLVEKPGKPEPTYHDIGDEFGENGNGSGRPKWSRPGTEFEKRVMAAQNIPNKKYWSKDDKPSLTKLRTLEKSMKPLRELPSQDYPVEWVDHVLEWYADKCKQKLLPLQAFVTSVNKPGWKARWLEEQGAELTGVSVVKEVAGSWM